MSLVALEGPLETLSYYSKRKKAITTDFDFSLAKEKM